MREERDELARNLETAKAQSDANELTKRETATLRAAHEDAVRTANMLQAELAEIRKREQAGAAKVSDHEAQNATLRERVERMTAELSQASGEAIRARRRRRVSVASSRRRRRPPPPCATSSSRSARRRRRLRRGSSGRAPTIASWRRS